MSQNGIDVRSSVWVSFSNRYGGSFAIFKRRYLGSGIVVYVDVIVAVRSLSMIRIQKNISIFLATTSGLVMIILTTQIHFRQGRRRRCLGNELIS